MSSLVRQRQSLMFRARSYTGFVIMPRPPIVEWLADLDASLEQSKGFFAGYPIVVDLSAVTLSPNAIAQLLASLEERNIRILGIEGIDPAATAPGLPPILRGGRGTQSVELLPDVEPAAAAPAAPKPQQPSLLVEDPVRSGQSVVFIDGDVTVLGSVASGAEIVAGGSIHVYGTLRGRAMAGATGNARARIFCHRVEAELLAIDAFYKTAEDMDDSLRRGPAQAWLEGEYAENLGAELEQQKGQSERWPRSVVVTSGKGGVGKTTSTAALGAALAQDGENVVVVDFDVGLRNLDLVMGAERRVVFDLINVIQGVAKLPQALIRDKRMENLSLLPASQTRDKDALTEEGVAKVIAELRTKFDWMICDSPAGIERGATLAMRHADVAIIVTNPEVSSVRDSDRIIGLLDSKTVKAENGERIEKHLLITRYDPARAARGEMLNIEDVLEILSMPLLGIIPESEEVLRASNLGSPVTLSNALSAPARAYFDAARRLRGEDVPMIVPSESRGLFNKLFGRRAA